MKKTYIINISTFLYNCGGVVVLHKLCHDLNSIGERALITSPITHPALNAPFVGDAKFNKEEAVVIYPEIVMGNPLKAKHVVRWALNTPGALECARGDGFYIYKQPTDLIFKFSEYFSLRDESESRGLLTVNFVDTDYFGPGETQREGSAYFVKKGGLHNKVHPDDAINLSEFDGDWTTMSKMLKKLEYFYCYDNACFWVAVAALCGCIAVVVPDSDMSAKEWYSKFPQLQCGVAYGLDEIENAKKTLPFAQESFREQQNAQLDTVRNFVKICETL